MLFRSSAYVDTSAIQRTWWKIVDEEVVVDVGYGTCERRVVQARRRADNEAEAMFISSLTENGLHAPVFDFDFPVVRHAYLESRPMWNLIFPGRKVPERRWRALIRCLERLGVLRGGFSTSHLAAHDLAWGPRLEFSVPVRLERSATPGHFHAYLEAEMSWRPYRALLHAMMKAGLIEDAWHDLVVGQAQAMLWKPGEKRRWLEARRARAASQERLDGY